MLASVVVILLWGCGTPAPSEPSPLMSLARDLPADSTLLVPVDAPPDLIDATLSSANDIPLVSFYSRNQPMITLCQSTAEACHRVLPTAVIVKRPEVADRVTVMIEAQETGVHMALSDALSRFWSGVELAPGRPAWLGTP